MTNTPETKTIPSLLISQDNVGKIKNFLQIILNEVWLIKRQEDLTMPGEENLRMIGRITGQVNQLLPGGAK